MNKEQSFSISMIRSMSILAIVLCHILQWYGNILAWWLNVGVQVFLCMSGFIFGNKNLPNYKNWYEKRSMRILKPYYIYLIIILPTLFIFEHVDLSLTQIFIYLLAIQGIVGGIPSIGHLWYITAIAICYIITPIIYKYNISKKDNNNFKFYFLMVLQFTILQLIFFKVAQIFGSVISTYLFGYYIGYRYNFCIPKNLKKFLLAMFILLLPLKIYLQYYYTMPNLPILIKVITFGFYWFHALFGCTIFIILFDIFKNLKRLHGNKLFNLSINIIDKYSYEIYITHAIYIRSAFSMMKITNFIIINILLVIFMITLSSYFLKKLSNLRLKTYS